MSRLVLRRDPFLDNLARHLREAPQRIHDEMARRAQNKLQDVLEAQFASASDPYGTPYIPPKDGHLPPMTRSRRLRDTLEVICTSSSAGIDIRVVGPEYAKYLQHGTRKMRARLIVPGRNVLALIWRQALKDAQREAIEAWYRGTR